MNYRFIVESRTNDPTIAYDALLKALDSHRTFRHLQWNISGQELSSHIKPTNIGASRDGDSWRFYVEVETNSPVWTRNEIQKAIRNNPFAAELGLLVEHGHISMSEKSTSDEVGSWLKERRDLESE